MNGNVHNLVKREYDRRQKKSNDELEARRQLTFSKVPRLEEIDREILLTGVKYNKAILLGESSAAEAVHMLLYKLNSLKSEKDKLLTEAGFSKDYLELRYTCPKCNDMGFIIKPGGKTEECSCYRQLVLDYLYSSSNLKLTADDNFSVYDESFYPDTVDEKKYGLRSSPRENAKYIKDCCISFVHNFRSETTKNLFFCGPTGVGKTFMANCIAVELMRMGITVLYQTAPVLFNTICEYRTRNFREDSQTDSAYRNIMEVELLIIDDLGTEPPSAARYAELLTILNTRHANNDLKPCKTIISTNIDARQLGDFYDERIVSRIIGGFDLFKFAGEDIRNLKRLRGK